jgi:hypothetical protein
VLIQIQAFHHQLNDWNCILINSNLMKIKAVKAEQAIGVERFGVVGCRV